ncbi:hypothetical protein HELRODRAFT_184700 [Helobdella robusta]|uniref:Uncharacterized protein n=1 Tax=Helobdella robusta TaxID=6412 RepID=T1FLT0_HELRO|nr:hypothetical protein HELRODRAFT_184700 [Helobdella robusta]ESO04499.1 hypothetical protein HELRODRAFT_184700 [Helobdella robusta]
MFKIWSNNGYYDTDERWECWTVFPGLGWTEKVFVPYTRPVTKVYKRSLGLITAKCPRNEGPLGMFIGTGLHSAFCRLPLFAAEKERHILEVNQLFGAGILEMNIQWMNTVG